MAKKNLTKTAEQRRKLEAFYSKRQSNWQKDEVIAVGRASGLTRQQVYKWLWDRKRAHLQTVKRKYTTIKVKLQRHQFSHLRIDTCPTSTTAYKCQSTNSKHLSSTSTPQCRSGRCLSSKARDGSSSAMSLPSPPTKMPPFHIDPSPSRKRHFNELPSTSSTTAPLRSRSSNLSPEP